MPDPSPVTIRKAVAADAAALSHYMAEWFLAAYGHASTAANTEVFVAAHYSPAQQAREIADPDTVTLLAFDADASWAGYAQLRLDTPAPPGVERPDAAEVGRFYFAPQQHGRGGAAQLMRALRTEALARGRRWLWLQAWQQAPQALRFYEKQGFERVGTAPFVIGADCKTDWVLRAPADPDAAAARP